MNRSSSRDVGIAGANRAVLGQPRAPLFPILLVNFIGTLGFSIVLPFLVTLVLKLGGNVSVANAYLVDVTDEKSRKESFGKMAVAGNLGFIIGPAPAGLLGAILVAALALVVVRAGRDA
jgi:MFS transporter, DHA1 family, tetracycline resistance protein